MPPGDITSIIETLGGISDQIAVQMIMGYLEVQLPFFALPIINQVTQFIISKFINLIVNKLEIVTINIVTIIETASEKSDFIKACEANAEAQIGQDKDLQAKAQADLINASREFFKLNPP